ncbi:MAG TPA: hypothetical protein VL614_15835 [Acetobacteraceae bacterium]|nr:hypothetical protein [Acetobacteraceae bacterium]
MPKFVRCMEGHAFDSEQSELCPTCGASVWRGPIDQKSRQGRGGAESPADNGQRPGSSKWLLAGGGGIVMMVAAVVGYLLLRPPASPPASPTALHSQTPTPDKTAPPTVTAQTQPPQPTAETPPQKPAPAGGQTAQLPPPGSWQSIPPATGTPAKPSPSGGEGQIAQPPPSVAVVAPPPPPPSASPTPSAPPPPVPQPASAVVPPPGAVASVPSNFTPAPPPPVTAAEVVGRAHFSPHSLTILDVDGTSVRLQGVMSQGDRQREAAERFLSYITQGTNQVRCEPEGNKTFECRAVRTDVRIGAGMIANGFASADPAAPAEFQHWEDDARRARRGIWGAQANR